MKKSLLALAVMAAASAASAQSSVTLWGIVDIGLVYGKSNASHRLRVEASNYGSSKIGFKGREDLGGGMYSGFWLESQLFPDTGGAGLATTSGNQTIVGADGSGLNFANRSTIEIGGPWGEVRLGRDYTPTGYAYVFYDPFGILGVGITLGALSQITMGIPGVTAVPSGSPRNVVARASNMIQYFTPPVSSGFFAHAAYWLGENASDVGASKDDGTGAALRAGVRHGPFEVSGSFGRTKYAPSSTLGNYVAWDLGGRWDVPGARIMGFLRSDSLDRITGKVAVRSWSLGSLVPVGRHEIRVNYSSSRMVSGVPGQPRASKIALGYVHNLSKRTALYVDFAHIQNRSGAALSLGGTTGVPNKPSNGMDMGMRHFF